MIIIYLIVLPLYKKGLRLGLRNEKSSNHGLIHVYARNQIISPLPERYFLLMYALSP